MNAIDISGQRFGRLFALRPVALTPDRGAYWYCLCSCGGTLLVLVALLRSGRVRSCGCLIRDRKRATSKNYLFGDAVLDCDRRAEYRDDVADADEQAQNQSLRSTLFRPGIPQ